MMVIMVMISLHLQKQPPFMISYTMVAPSFLPPRLREQSMFPKLGEIKGI